VSPPGRRPFAAGLIAGVLAGIWLGANADELGGLGELVGEEPSLNEEAAEVIEENYFEAVDESRLGDASIRGMIDVLRKRYDDRFSHYFDPRQLERFREATSGTFSGIGLGVREVKRGLRVGTVFEDTPAERAGIREGDVITAVDGRSIAGEAADIATAMIKGPSGTSVHLEVLRPATGGVRKLSLERAEVRIPAVQGELRRAGGEQVAYVRFAAFNEGAHGELREEAERLYRRGAEALLLDLRGNGGGLLNEAVLTASVFIERGVIVTTEGRTQPKTDYDAVGGALDRRPTVVLINRDTASAAEILAAALEERGLATLVGTRSFGKGSFQEVIELDNGGAIDLTVGEYLTSDGRSLAGKGIEPQVRAKDDPRTGADEALRKGLEALGRELAGSQ
jgi:carboxyl-terminal processing protease